MRSRLPVLLITTASILLSGCAASPDGWSGAEDGSPATQLAKRDCECMATYYQAIGIDVPLLMKHHPALMAGNPPADERIIREMNAGLPLQLSKLRSAFNQWKMQPACHRSILDELEQGQMKFESIVPLLDQHCALYQLSITY